MFSVLGLVGGTALANDAADMGSSAFSTGIGSTMRFVKGIATGVQATQNQDGADTSTGNN